MQYWNTLKNLIFIKKTGIPHFLKFERILLSGLIFYIILATYAVSALPSNLISNPGFELGTIQPLNWNLVNSGANTVTWDTDSHTGTRSIRSTILEQPIPGAVMLSPILYQPSHFRIIRSQPG